MQGPIDQSFAEAIRCLDGRKQRATETLKEMRGLPHMAEWLALLGYSEADLNSLNIIHVAGTDGKGSTCAFISSMLVAAGKRVGLYTSPHLVSVCERIRLNGVPVPESTFATRFWEVWEKVAKDATEELGIPRYLQFLALLSFHIFLQEKVDFAVYEPHMGGEYDATNVVRSPAATVITPISLDHVQYLGPTIQNVAWHKAGIFKPGAAAFSAPQDMSVIPVLQSRAAEKGTSLKVIDVDRELPVPQFQRLNCSVAAAVARHWLLTIGATETDIGRYITQGIDTFNWPGRYHHLHHGNNHWFLDGAHNESAMSRTVEWFVETSTEESRKHRTGNPPMKILIFAHYSKRDGARLLQILQDSLTVEHLILTIYGEVSQAKLEKRMCYEHGWKTPSTTIWVRNNVTEAIEQVRKITQPGGGAHILVTGSLHLVGGALAVLGDSE